MKKIQSAAESLYEDDSGRLYTWKDIQKDIDDWVKDSSFREMFELENGELDDGYYDYFEKDRKTPKYYKIYKDFWDISSNGAISEIEGTEEKWNEYNEMWNINSAKGNNIIKSSYEDKYGIEDLKLVSEQANNYANEILSAAKHWIPAEQYDSFKEREFSSGDWTVVVNPSGYYSFRGSGLNIDYYYKTRYCAIYTKEYKLNQHFNYDTQSWEDLLVQDPRRENGLHDLMSNNAKGTADMGIDWREVLRTLKTIVSSKRGNNMIKSSKAQKIFDKAILKAAELVKKANEEEIYDNAGNDKLNRELSDITVDLVDLPFDLEPQELKSYIKKIVPADYFDDDRCWSYLYDVVYDDIYKWVGFNTKSVNSSKKLIMSKTLSQSEREGMEVVLGIICGYYGADDDDKRYEIVKEQLSPEELNQLDEICTYVLADEQGHKTVSDRVLKNDIPLLRKVYNIIDDNDLFKNSQGDYDWDAMSGFEKICLTSSRRNNMKKIIKSASGSWEYQTDDMDEAEAKIGDIGISFTEPLLVADDGTIFTRTGFNEWLKFLEKEYPDNWTDAYEAYHRDTDEEFIAMCEEPYFNHDFGHTLFLYSEGLKSIAESIAGEVPSNEAPFSIPSGFAFELYPEEEEPSGFNSYWIDDMELPESFIWGINPSLGDRFDVIIDPEYLWNGTDNINSNRRTNMKKVIKSVSVNKQLTGNFTDFNDALDYAKTLLEEQYSDCEVSLGSDEGGDFFTISNDKINHKFYVDEDGATMVDDNGNIVGTTSMLEDWEDLAASVMDLMDIYAIDYDDVYDDDASYLNNSRKPIKSGRYIKSGTSNFAENRASADFPLVVYIAETYIADEETGEPTDERDYDAEQWEYDDAYDFAKDLADEMGIEISNFDIHRMRYDSRDAGYEQPFFVGIGSGYYEGLQIFIDDNLYFSPEDIANDEGLLDEFEYAEDQADYNRVVKEVEERVQNEWVGKINDFLNKLCSEYGWMKLGVSARFSNGETWYSKIDSAKKFKKSKKQKSADERAKDEGADITCSRKSIKSGMSYEQALREFTSNGKPWGDYWSMQYDWTMFVDSLERDDLVDYEEARWWDNPCTPETFREWKEE